MDIKIKVFVLTIIIDVMICQYLYEDITESTIDETVNEESEDQDLLLKLGPNVANSPLMDQSVRLSLCGPDNRPQVVGAFRVDKDLIYLMVKHPTHKSYYRLSGFSYYPGNDTTLRFEFKDIQLMDNKWTNTDPNTIQVLNNITLWFLMNSKSGQYLVGTAYELDESIDEYMYQIKGYKIDNNQQAFESLNMKPINLNINLYKEGEDPDNVMALFNKFPQEDIPNLMHAINNFPFDSQSTLPERYFIYYMEKRPKFPLVVNQTYYEEYKFRRHIMIREKQMYGQREATDWVHDIASGRCFVQNIVSASFTLTDTYLVDKRPNIPITNVFGQLPSYFDMIEFENDYYHIKRVYVDSQRVDQNLTLLKTGFVGELLGCGQPFTPTTPTTLPPPLPTGKPPDQWDMTLPDWMQPDTTVSGTSTSSPMSDSTTLSTTLSTTAVPMKTTTTISTPSTSKSTITQSTTMVSSLSISNSTTLPTTTVSMKTIPTISTPSMVSSLSTLKPKTSTITPTITTTSTSVTTIAVETTLKPSSQPSASLTWLWILILILLIVLLLSMCLLCYCYSITFRGIINYLLCLTPTQPQDNAGVTAKSSRPLARGSNVSKV